MRPILKVPVLAVCPILVLCGCASIDVTQFRRDLDPILAKPVLCDPGAAGFDITADKEVKGKLPEPVGKDRTVDSILAAFDDLKRATEARKAAQARALAFYRNGVHGRASLANALDAAKEVQPRDVEPIKLSHRDFENFVAALAMGNFSGGWTVSTLGRMSDGNKGTSELFRAYYDAYTKGEFVDRFGTKFSKPEIKGSVGNEVITGVVHVFLEALADAKLKTPLLVTRKNGKIAEYVLSPKQIPTSALHGVRFVEINDRDTKACGITRREADAVRYLANLAADRSTLVNGVLMDAFGGIELAAGVGPHFSFGDNRTLGEVIRRTSEVVARRATEWLAIDYFIDHGYESDAKSRPAASFLGDRRDPVLEFVRRF